jgi:hypothetical protein
MINLKRQITLTMALGVLSLIAGLFSHLALTDIYHGEADASLEWRIVQLSALVILAFIGMTLFTLTRVRRAMA